MTTHKENIKELTPRVKTALIIRQSREIKLRRPHPRPRNHLGGSKMLVITLILYVVLFIHIPISWYIVLRSVHSFRYCQLVSSGILS